jgi:hypothetical protein
MVEDSGGVWSKEREWGCGITPKLGPFRLHRGRRNSIMTYEGRNSLGAVHSHPSIPFFPAPPSPEDLVSHCEGVAIHGVPGYVSIAVANDPMSNDEITLYVLEGAPGVPMHIATATVAVREQRLRTLARSQFPQMGYLLYMNEFERLCSELGVSMYVLNIPKEE